MVVLFGAIAVACAVWTVVVVRGRVRSPIRLASPPILEGLAPAVGGAVWVCLFAWLGASSVPIGAAVASWLALSFLILLVGYLVLVVVRKRARGKKERAFRRFLALEFRGLKRSVAGRVARLREFVAPLGWGEFSMPSIPKVSNLEFRVFFGIYLAIVLLGFAAMPIFVLAAFYSMPEADQTVLGSISGLAALLIASCLTLATLFTFVLLYGLRFFAVVETGFSWSLGLRAAANWCGYGVASGAACAALMPLLTRVLPGSTRLSQDEATSLATVLSPGLLIELPAIGAVLGYLVGLCAIFVKVGERSKNLVLRRFVAPAIFLGVLLIQGRWLVSPSALFSFIASTASRELSLGGVSCNDIERRVRYADAGGADVIVAYFEKCEGGLAISGAHLAVGVAFVLLLLLVAAVGSDVKVRPVRREVRVSQLSRTGFWRFHGRP